MTVSSQTSTATFAGNGVATAFPLPFRFFSDSDIRAYFIDSTTGVATPMVLGTDYTLTGAGEPEVDGNPVSVLTTSVPLAMSRGMYVERIMPQIQETDIVNQGEFFGSTHEDVFDRLTMLIQQSNSNSQGAIRVAIGDPEPARLVPAAARAGRMMGFDGLGNPIALNAVSGSADALALLLADQVNPANGSAMLGHEGSTVRAALLADSAAIDVLEAESASARADIDDLLALTNATGNKSFNSVNGNIISGGFAADRCVNILGDSISYGANAQNIQRDSYVGILRKMLNIEFGSNNMGWLSCIASTSNADGTYNEYHSQLSQSGTWTGLADAGAAHIPSGYALQSSVALSTQVYRIPLSQRYMRVWYDGTVTGVIEVVISGVVVQTITTTGAGTGYDRAAALELGALVSTNQGIADVTIRCASGTIRFTGFEFTNDTAGNYRLNNFSRDGRAGRYVSQDVINRACAGCYFMVWALGTNDVPGGGAAVTEFTQRMDWLIAAAAANKTRVVLLDIVYGQADTNGIRAQLRRAHEAIPGSILVEAAKIWAVDGVELTSAQWIARNLAAGVHPEEAGHRLIAEVTAQRIGLSVTSKREATRRDPMWKALNMGGSGVANSSPVPGSITSWRIGERSIDLIVNLVTVPVALTTIGTIPAADLPASGFTAVNFKSNPDVNGRTGLFTLSASGVLQYRPDPSSGAPTDASAMPPASVNLNASILFNDTATWP